MINLDTIEQEILTLEAKDTSYAVVERLAWLYIVKDHIATPKANERSGELIGGEFVQVCSNVPIQSLMAILSEHMEAVRLIYPKEYEHIIDRIKDLGAQ